MKSFQIDFNWYHLASWVNITEQWPYRTTCLILYHDTHEESLEDSMTLKSVYDKYVLFISVLKVKKFQLHEVNDAENKTLYLRMLARLLPIPSSDFWKTEKC